MNNDDCPNCKKSSARLTEAVMNMAILQLKAAALEKEVVSIKEHIKKHHLPRNNLKFYMQSNTTPLTIQILLNEPLTTEPTLLVDGTSRLLASKELYKLNPVVFFPVCAGGCYTDYIVSREYAIDINDNSILIRTDFASYPNNYGAIWILSEDRKTLTYSHTQQAQGAA